MKKADLCQDRTDEKVAEIRYKQIVPSGELSHFDTLRRRRRADGNLTWLSENFPRSVTWLRSAEDIQTMINKIEGQVSSYKKGECPVSMNIRGAGAFGVFDSWAHNCYTWSRETLQIAKIKLHNYQDDSLIPTLITTPRSNISLDSLSCKETIKIGVGWWSVDVTKDVDDLLNHRPWKILDDNILDYQDAADIKLASGEGEPIILTQFQISEINKKVEEGLRQKMLDSQREQVRRHPELAQLREFDAVRNNDNDETERLGYGLGLGSAVVFAVAGPGLVAGGLMMGCIVLVGKEINDRIRAISRP